MAEPDEPPLSTGTVAMAAAAGAFGGAILGVIAAGALMGDGDNGAQSQAVPVESEASEVVVAER